MSGGLPATAEAPAPHPRVALVGNPNVGKSVVFNNLTGRYVTVSNYPGTTVEVSKGEATIAGHRFTVWDTPGMYSTVPISGEEQVARRMILERDPAVVVHVVDAKNLERSLPLTFQLQELGQRVVLMLNVLDEAEKLGLAIDFDGLSRAAGMPVVGAVATTRRGMDGVKRAIDAAAAAQERAAAAPVDYGLDIEAALSRIGAALPKVLARRARGSSLLLLQDDAEIAEHLERDYPAAWPAIREAAAAARASVSRNIASALATARHARAQALVEAHVATSATKRRAFAERLSELTINPWTGVPILLLVLYIGLYQFVGVFGAGKVVDFLEHTMFAKLLVQPVNALLLKALPGTGGWHYWTRELFGGEYGIVTLGVTYAFAIVLPIVTMFFAFFSVLEDSGYFPRLAMLLDRVFKRIGLNGRAVIPIVLGFGCATMATMVTRIQETKRERVITTLLLALAIPCSAQYGVITALLAHQPAAFLGISWSFAIWASILAVMFLATGLLASRALKGEAASFYMELPPLRVPRLSNVAMKTLARLKWYFMEVFPLFVLASVMIWVGRITGLFAIIIHGLEPLVAAIGMPKSAAPVFLYGFFRRDFGAAGLFDLANSGALTQAQVLVACVTLTLFIPCVAQFLIMKKERGLKMTLVMTAGVMATAFAVGGLTNVALRFAGFGR